jgi:DNA polymerase/3'-5' exonuclease PolX
MEWCWPIEGNVVVVVVVVVLSFLLTFQNPKPNLPHRRIDFQLIARKSWPFALLYFTGSGLFNRSMRLYAGKNGNHCCQFHFSVVIVCL